MPALNSNLKVGEMSGKATTQLTGFGFDSFIEVDERIIGIGSNGIYVIGETAGETVSSLFETATFDFGHEGSKTVLFLYIGFESEGSLQVTPIVDDIEYAAIAITPQKTGQQYLRVKMPKGIKGRYWRFRFENVDGADFSIDSVTALVSKHGRGRKVY